MKAPPGSEPYKGQNGERRNMRTLAVSHQDVQAPRDAERTVGAQIRSKQETRREQRYAGGSQPSRSARSGGRADPKIDPDDAERITERNRDVISVRDAGVEQPR